MINFKKDDFILVKKRALSKDHCKVIINWFESNKEYHEDGFFGTKDGFFVDKNIKESTDILINIRNPIVINTIISDPLNDSFAEYQQKYNVLENVQDWTVDDNYLIQKYPPFGGYKSLHFESSGTASSSRIIAWMFYLNDIKGGGTEFPYLNKKFDSTEGTLLVWPAGFTHAHRSIPTKHEKYIITGWASFI